MNAEQFFEAIGLADERMVEAAAVRPARPRRTARRWLPLVACAAFVVVGIGVVRGLPSVTLNSAATTETAEDTETAQLFPTQESTDGAAATASYFDSEGAADDAALSGAAPEAVSDKSLTAPQLYAAGQGTAEQEAIEQEAAGYSAAQDFYGTYAVYSVAVTADALPQAALAVAEALDTLALPATRANDTGADTVFLFTANDALLGQLAALLAEKDMVLSAGTDDAPLPAGGDAVPIALVLSVSAEGES